MAYTTRGMRDRARDAVHANDLCECGHFISIHRELPIIPMLEDGIIVMAQHPDYRPCEFHCRECECVRSPAGRIR